MPRAGIAVWAFLSSLAAFQYAGASTTQTATLDTSGNYNISWTYDSESIMFQLTVRTTGWVGLGLSPNGGMENSDIVIIDGTGTVTDRHTGSEKAAPTEDVDQDWNFMSHSVTDGVTTIQIQRALTTCHSDLSEDRDITTDTTRLIYAYGSTSALSQHLTTTRGTKSLYLLGTVSTGETQSTPADAQDYDFRVYNATIPTDATSYLCTIHPMPTVASKHHVISFEPVVKEGNEAYVHHALVYGCYNNINGSGLISSGQHSHLCFGGTIPGEMAACRSVLFAWAIGGTKFYYPTEAGYALGVSDTPDYVVMETHYDNPSGTSGVVDDSGIRITYTSTLRTNDLDMIQVGSVVGIVVPPERNTTDVTFMCSSGCTQEAFPASGITVFAGMLHSHLLGRSITLQHYTTSGSSSVLMRDTAYDFNFQDTRILSSFVTISQGDSLQITCSMDSSGQSSATYGGLGTTDEMCLAFIYYYPKVDLAECGTNPIIQQGQSAATFYASIGVSDGSSLTGSVQADTASVTWTSENGVLVQDSYYNYNHLSYCTKKDRTSYNDSGVSVASSNFQRVELEVTDCSGAAFIYSTTPMALLVLGFIGSRLTC